MSTAPEPLETTLVDYVITSLADRARRAGRTARRLTIASGLLYLAAAFAYGAAEQAGLFGDGVLARTVNSGNLTVLQAQFRGFDALLKTPQSHLKPDDYPESRAYLAALKGDAVTIADEDGSRRQLDPGSNLLAGLYGRGYRTADGEEKSLNQKERAAVLTELVGFYVNANRYLGDIAARWTMIDRQFALSDLHANTRPPRARDILFRLLVRAIPAILALLAIGGLYWVARGYAREKFRCDERVLAIEIAREEDNGDALARLVGELRAASA